MEGDFHLPDEHLLNLNPRPRNPNERRRQSTILYDPEYALDHSNKTQEKTTRFNSNHPGTMSEASSPATPVTRLPVPRGFGNKGKDQQKENRAESEDASPRDRWYYKSDTSSPMTSEGSSAKSADKDRDQYWRKVRGKLDKDSSDKGKQGKDKQKEYYQGAYRKLMSLASGPRNEMAKHKLRFSDANASDTKLPLAGISRRTGIPSPSDKIRSSSGGIPRISPVRPPQRQKKAQKKEHRVGNNTKESASQKPSDKADNTTDSSSNSHPSVSSLSGPTSSATEWEDKFIVNMPSAKDPNPPSMTARQITEFQKSMDEVQREGGAMIDPETSPSPRTTTPEDKPGSTDTSEKTPNGREGDDPSTTPANEANDKAANPGPTLGRYYSPEEVGKKRFSTIWEESPLRVKKKTVDTSEDGFFLGCKQINGTEEKKSTDEKKNADEEKNPDEILYFSTTNERPKVVDVSAPVGRRPRAATKTKPTGRRMTPALEEKNLIQKEWDSISQNLKNGQNSKSLPKTLCQEPPCQQRAKPQTAPKAPGKENSQTLAKSIIPSDKDSQRDDDVLMNTPTVSHTRVAAENAKAQKSSNTQLPKPNLRATGESPTTSQSKPQTRISPSGLRNAVPNPREKGEDQSKTPSVTPSKSSQGRTAIPITKSRTQGERSPESPRGIRGFMHIPGIVKSSTENFTESLRGNLNRPSPPGSTAKVTPARSVSGPSQVVSAPSSQDMSPVSPITEDTRTEKFSARVVEVAELDGHQLHTANSHQEIDIHPDNSNDAACPLTLSLVFDILILSITHMQRLCGDCMNNQYPQMMLRSVLQMVEHCAYVGKSISLAISTYRSTGSWPKPKEKDLGRSLTDLGQAIVYLIVLGFLMIILGRAAGYIVLVGSWVVWFAKPFGWAFGLIAKALVP